MLSAEAETEGHMSTTTIDRLFRMAWNREALAVLGRGIPRSEARSRMAVAAAIRLNRAESARIATTGSA